MFVAFAGGTIATTILVAFASGGGALDWTLIHDGARTLSMMWAGAATADVARG